MTDEATPAPSDPASDPAAQPSTPAPEGAPPADAAAPAAPPGPAEAPATPAEHSERAEGRFAGAFDLVCRWQDEVTTESRRVSVDWQDEVTTESRRVSVERSKGGRYRVELTRTQLSSGPRAGDKATSRGEGRSLDHASGVALSRFITVDQEAAEG